MKTQPNPYITFLQPSMFQSFFILSYKTLLCSLADSTCSHQKSLITKGVLSVHRTQDVTCRVLTRLLDSRRETGGLKGDWVAQCTKLLATTPEVRESESQ